MLKIQNLPPPTISTHPLLLPMPLCGRQVGTAHPTVQGAEYDRRVDSGEAPRSRSRAVADGGVYVTNSSSTALMPTNPRPDVSLMS
ncbi:hypothetical protein Tsubulata_036896 [Turnera subulata]|uniref:Uncharacterized protein n=1 Tax=Turnera subulata TaxID=218843 RepID=A0A9Q0G0N7_9ROSI|nr:hypothetical protein Tsubulata_036896 [Turnera subulata]